MIIRHATTARLSHAVELPLTGTLVITAGEVADDPGADIVRQTEQVLAKIDALLAQAGSHKDNAVAAYIWLPDIADFEAMNSVWDKWITPGKAPARACVEAKLADPRLKVEIQVIAAKSASN